MTEPAAIGAPAPIVVTVNAARRCAETLELALMLAASVGADLEVVFVEDVNLLRLADLPVSREVDRLSGMTRNLDSRCIARALRCEVQRLRREMARLGESSKVRSSLRVVRGHYFSEALAASAGVNVTFVHGARRSFPGLEGTAPRPHASGTARGQARRTGAGVPLWTLFDGSPGAARALEVALLLARTLPGNLLVLISGHDASVIESRKRKARSIAEHSDLQFREVAENWFAQPSRVVSGAAGGLLVLAREDPEREGSPARNYIESLSVPVVLVT